MNVPQCNLGRDVPIIHFHSVLDGSVPYQGGTGSGPSSHYNPPLGSVFNVWKTNNSCDDRDTITNDSNLMHVKWSNCNCGNRNELYLTQDGRHSWHGGKKTLTGDDVSVVNANDKMWAFFKSVSECSVSIQEEIFEKVNLYPNPSQKGTLITLETGQETLKTVEVYNVIGEKVFHIIPNNKRVRLVIKDSGIYIVKILSENDIYTTKKLIVN
jgi:hypothetical protein